MKITPIAQGLPAPIESARDQSRIINAKAIAAGELPPVSTGDPQADRTQESVRRIKMRTNATISSAEEQLATALSPEGSISDNIEPTEEAMVEETKPLSPQFAALAKAKRALQIERAQVAKEKAEIEALKGRSDFDPSQYVSKADLLARPLDVLQGTGVTYDQLTEAILNNQSSQNIDPQKLRAEIKEELKKELLGEFTTRDQQSEQQVLAEIKREATALVTNNENFEAINQARAEQVVVDLIHRTWKKTGEVLDVNTAAQLVEDQLIEDALPFAKLNKVQRRLTPAEAQQVTVQPPKPGTKVMRTLTNRDSARPTMDRRARAIAAMQGTLRKG